MASGDILGGGEWRYPPDTPVPPVIALSAADRLAVTTALYLHSRTTLLPYRATALPPALRTTHPLGLLAGSAANSSILAGDFCTSAACAGCGCRAEAPVVAAWAAGWPPTQDGGRDGSITQAMTLRVTFGYAHDRLTFLMCISATEALVQEVLFRRPGSVTMASLVLPSWGFMSL